MKARRDENDSKPKTAADIQKEMNKWARRQEKVKMSFKSADSSSSAGLQQTTSATVQPSPRLADKKPWADADEEEEETTQFAGEPPIALPTGRMRNVALPLNYQSPRHVLSGVSNEAAVGHVQPLREPAGRSGSVPSAPFDEEQFLDRSKATCLLCRRQFSNGDTLNKHVQLSDLHKTNLSTKRKEFHQQLSIAHRGLLDTTLQYRDRARERRQMHGYDSAGPSNDEADYSDPKVAEELASMKAKVQLDDSNIGNRMLKLMGWSEGQGLGRNAQGIVNPLVADQRVQGVGLGATGSKVAYGTSRRERMQQSVIQRFNELQD